MKALIGSLLLTVAMLGMARHVGAEDKTTEKKVDTRVFEMRTYHAEPGKMDALQARFRNHTVKFFEKHGMTVVGFWTPSDPKEADTKLIYILAYPSKEAADKSWAAFRADADWGKVKKETEKDGPLHNKIDSVYLKPTDFSPIK